jgi:dynein heavy chain
VFLQGNVEVWLGDLLRMSKKSIHGIIRSAAISISDPGFKLIEFENMFPAKVKHSQHKRKKLTISVYRYNSKIDFNNNNHFSNLVNEIGSI